jgi:endonuclease-3
LRQLAEIRRLGAKLRLAAEWGVPWKSLISTILSARTTDRKTIEVSKKLYARYSNIHKLANANLGDVKSIIKPVNFYKTKAKNIINCAKKIVDGYGGRIPCEFDELIKLDGVGRKTANVFLAHQGGARIGVDTHVGYISQKMGWTRHSKPQQIETDLEKLFPRGKWRSINYTLVRFGQTYKSRAEKNKILARVKRI